jgi:hypothetical protein
MPPLGNDPKNPHGMQVPPDARPALSLVSAETERGRLLYVPDVRELLRDAKSAWWVRNHFAPEHRFKVGRSPAWWESEAVAWLDAQRQR